MRLSGSQPQYSGMEFAVTLQLVMLSVGGRRPSRRIAACDAARLAQHHVPVGGQDPGSGWLCCR